ncbi:peptidase M13 family protein [Francisella tularensis subsp. tularensis]|nr:M13-type metalloendopeptidase [Francisella tularensis]AKU73132.1 peptidase M13 family protein [Francisella tularensis subsp. tularensis]
MAANYGGIGAVIGHEISHAFDDQGSKFDYEGNLKEWMTKEDRMKFKAITQKLVEQYSVYEPIKGIHVNGELTLGENIADNAGLAVAYDAYKLSLNGQKLLLLIIILELKDFIWVGHKYGEVNLERVDF